MISICALTLFFKVNAQIITTVAGCCDSAGFSGDGGPATLAKLWFPQGVTIDKNGYIYIENAFGRAIRRVDTNGIITTIAGNGIYGFAGDGGPATAAEFKNPGYFYISKDGKLYIPDQGDGRIRLIDTDGIITTIAGNGSWSEGPDGCQATATAIGPPAGAIMDTIGNLYFVETFGEVRKVNTAGIISTIAGDTTGLSTFTFGYGGDGGPATDAELNNPVDIAMDKAGNIYISDLGNDRIRKVDTAGIITTYAGNGIAGYTGDYGPATAARIDAPEGIIVDGAGNIFFSDENNNVVRKIDTDGIITTIAGNGYGAGSDLYGGFSGGFSGDGGPATDAEMFAPAGLALDKYGNLYIADWQNNRIRKVTNVGVPLGVRGVESGEREVNVWPNPATNEVHIEGAMGNEVSICSIIGQIYNQYIVTKNNEVIDVANLPKGMYLVEIIDVSTGKKEVKKILKE